MFWRRMKRQISLGNFIDTLPRSTLLYRFCRRYVDHYNSENNDDMSKNGEARWLREVIPQCNVVFDVGANIGDWSALVRNLSPLARIDCFEPCSATFARLQSRNLSGNIHLNRMGLSESGGETRLFIFEGGAGTNSLYHRQGLSSQQTQEEIIRLDTLDAYCNRENIRQIDLLKLDVEGHELKVLKGATQMFTQGGIQRIQFEYGGTFIDARILLKDIFDFLTQFGFRLHKIYPHGLRFVEYYGQHLENFQYQNWVALR
jgi:FkbM family methyltransferase